MKKDRKVVLTFSCNLIFLVISPTMLSVNLIDISAITSINVIMVFASGVTITILSLLKLFLVDLSRYKIFFILLTQIIIIIQILLLLPSDLIQYDSDTLTLFFDLRGLYSILIGIPILTSIYSLYSYQSRKSELTLEIIILYVINLRKHIGKSQSVKNILKKRVDIDSKIKSQLLVNYNYILLNMRASKKNLIVNSRNSYKLTEKGESILKNKNTNRILKKKIKNHVLAINNLEVWDKRSIRIYSFKQKMKNIFIK